MGCKVGLGVDSSAICSGDIFYTMRIMLHTKRARDNTEVYERGKIPKKLAASVDEVIYVTALGGAEAIHREKELGSVEAGKLADITLMSTDGPSMVASLGLAAVIVLHATPAEVETVIVNGEIVKKDGKLTRINWGELKKELLENRLEWRRCINTLIGHKHRRGSRLVVSLAQS